MSSEALVEDALRDSIRLNERLLADFVPSMVELAELLVGRLRRGGRLYLVGNGGSAAEAQHIATEFIVRFKEERGPLPAIALTTDTSVITAAGNDFDYSTIFSRQVEALAGEDDVVAALSTSGESENVLEAVRAAGRVGATTVAFTGDRRGPLVALADIAVEVPSSDTQRIQEAHLVLWHIVCELVDRAMVDGPATRV
jgi:D-sedoheptulose 7-phosphate isomerase